MQITHKCHFKAISPLLNVSKILVLNFFCVMDTSGSLIKLNTTVICGLLINQRKMLNFSQRLVKIKTGFSSQNKFTDCLKSIYEPLGKEPLFYRESTSVFSLSLSHSSIIFICVCPSPYTFMCVSLPPHYYFTFALYNLVFIYLSKHCFPQQNGSFFLQRVFAFPGPRTTWTHRMC